MDFQTRALCDFNYFKGVSYALGDVIRFLENGDKIDVDSLKRRKSEADTIRSFLQSYGYLPEFKKTLDLATERLQNST